MNRSAAPMFPSKVDFLIAGVQKGGTSALHSYLALHPQLVPPRITKELQFFSRGQKKVEWLYRQFPKDDYGDKLCYESTPDYICSYEFLSTIAAYKARHNPDLKLLLVFRNPVDRAYSQWAMTRTFVDAVNDPEDEVGIRIKRFNPHAYGLYRSLSSLPSFGECFQQFLDRFQPALPIRDLKHLNRVPYIHKIPGQFFVRGLYCFQLAALLSLFPREDLFFTESGQLKSHTAATLDRITDFLGVAPYGWPEAEIGVPRHVSKYRHPIEPATRQQVATFYEPYNQQFFDMSGQAHPWR